MLQWRAAAAAGCRGPRDAGARCHRARCFAGGSRARSRGKGLGRRRGFATGWDNLTVASAMGAGAAWLSNAFKNIISVICTDVIGVWISLLLCRR